MQKNWYAVYTKPRCERKVSLLLSKRRIENFFPLNYRKSSSHFWKMIAYEPVFNSYVFVRCTEVEIIELGKKVSGILSLLYWKGEPATINEGEIDAIKEFTNHQHDITLEKMETNFESKRNEGISYSMDGRLLKVRTKSSRLDLPSLRLTMVAVVKEENAKEQGILGEQLTHGLRSQLSN